MDDYTLVVVDMQPVFATSEAVQAAVACQINLARANNCGIVFSEIPGWGWNDEFPPTYESLRLLVRGYLRKRTVYKSRSDGSLVIRAACVQAGFRQDKFRVCGVNRVPCVLSTVIGLLNSGSQVEVVQEACHQGYDNGKCGWDRFPWSEQLSSVA